MKELHHIVPRCMGGTDDPDNLLWLSPRAHAIISVMQSEHYQHPCLHGRQLKYLPLTLRGRGLYWVLEAGRLGTARFAELIATNPEFRGKHSEKCSLVMRERWGNYETREELLRAVLESIPKARLEAQSPEACSKRKDTFRKVKHQQGHRNSQYGTMWITDGYSNQKIKRGEPIPEGFRPGRTC